MDADLLLCDAGNSNLKVALAGKGRVLAQYVLPCVLARTADSLGLLILQILGEASCRPAQIRACAACSVIPGFQPMLRGAVKRFLDCPVFFAPQDLPVPLKNCYANPAEAGADRLVAAYAARRQFPEAGGIVLADFGSIATFDCIAGNEWRGGLLFPGFSAALSSMATAAPALPKLEAEPFFQHAQASCAPQENTRSAMLEGVFQGYIALSEGLCGKLRKTLPAPVFTVATGGIAPALASASIFDAVIPNLVLEGLALLYYETGCGS